MAENGLAANEAIVFDMELELEEDIDAYLVDFVFLARLGVTDEARKLAEQILWRHIDFFPVFAEVCAFYIMLNEHQAVSELLLDLAANRISFADPHQQGFVRTAALFARQRLKQATMEAVREKVGTDGKRLAGVEVTLPDQDLFLHIDYNSTPQVSHRNLQESLIK